MLEPIETYISDNYTYEDYKKLDFKLESTEDIWEIAIKIFIDRIETRYFLAISKLMEKEDRYAMRKYGFAIVTLQCSLIDTLAKFRYGPKHPGCRDRFTTFLEKYFVKNSNIDNVAVKIYEDIRCGIVHSGATDNKSGLTSEGINLVTLLPDKKSISLNLLILQEKIKEYFKDYTENLKNKDKYELRKNFVYRMDKICKVKP